MSAFQQHVFTSYRCLIFVILVIFQVFSLLFVMVIYDQGSLMLLLQKLQLAEGSDDDKQFFSHKVFFN